MKVFVWDYVAKLTDRYHSDGGLVVFADNLERAIALAKEDGVSFSDETPCDVRIVEGGAEAVYIMPDAGCC